MPTNLNPDKETPILDKAKEGIEKGRQAALRSTNTAALEAARKMLAGQGRDPFPLSTGVIVKLGNVSPATLTDAQSRIEYPPIPIWFNPDKDREEENPQHPDYIAACNHIDQLRAVALMDTLALLGIELVEGLPEDDKWLRQLKQLDRFGHIDLSGFDLEDDLDQEFLYKKHIALGQTDWQLMFQLAGVDEAAVAAAEATFQGDQT